MISTRAVILAVFVASLPLFGADPDPDLAAKEVRLAINLITRDLDMTKTFQIDLQNKFDWVDHLPYERKGALEGKTLPPLIVSGILLDLKSDHDGCYALIQTRCIVGPNDFVSIFRGSDMRSLERWVVVPHSSKREGQLIVLLHEDAPFNALKPALNKPVSLMVKPIENPWLHFVRDIWASDELSTQEKQELLKSHREGKSSAISSFDARIPVAEALYTDVLKHKGPDFNSNILRRQWDWVGIETDEDRAFFERIGRVKDWQSAEAAALLEESRFASWKVAFAVAFKLSEAKLKEGVVASIELSKFEVELRQVDADQKRYHNTPAPPSADNELMAALEKGTGQQLNSLEAYIQWWEQTGKNLEWKTLPALPKEEK